MIKTYTQYFCDACENEITGYSGSIQILRTTFSNDECEIVDQDGYLFCEKCMKSFSEWKKNRKNGKGLV